MNAETKKSNQVSVLQFGNQNYFISKLLSPLHRTLTKPFDSNFLLGPHVLVHPPLREKQAASFLGRISEEGAARLKNHSFFFFILGV